MTLSVLCELQEFKQILVTSTSIERIVKGEVCHFLDVLNDFFYSGLRQLFVHLYPLNLQTAWYIKLSYLTSLTQHGQPVMWVWGGAICLFNQWETRGSVQETYLEKVIILST